MSSAQPPVTVSPAPLMTQPQSLEKESGSGPNPPAAPPASASKNYKGFVAGVFSGIAKLSGEFIQR